MRGRAFAKHLHRRGNSEKGDSARHQGKGICAISVSRKTRRSLANQKTKIIAGEKSWRKKKPRAVFQKQTVTMIEAFRTPRGREPAKGGESKGSENSLNSRKKGKTGRRNAIQASNCRSQKKWGRTVYGEGGAAHAASSNLEKSAGQTEQGVRGKIASSSWIGREKLGPGEGVVMRVKQGKPQIEKKSLGPNG